jgi:hypothetical protein
LKWDGTPFDPKPFRTKRGHTDWDEEKIQPRLPRPTHHGNRVLPTPGYASVPPSAASGSQGVSIEAGDDGSHGVSITRLTTGEPPGGFSVGPLKEASKPSSGKPR